MKCLLLLLALGCTLHAAPPNIVFILADDLGYADVGYHGGEIQTPHLDQLAGRGAKLEAFYGMPVCTPSRSALMTGRYPIRYGRQYNVLRPNSKVGLALGEKLLPQLLHDAGYATRRSANGTSATSTRPTGLRDAALITAMASDSSSIGSISISSRARMRCNAMSSP